MLQENWFKQEVIFIKVFLFFLIFFYKCINRLKNILFKSEINLYSDNEVLNKKKLKGKPNQISQKGKKDCILYTSSFSRCALKEKYYTSMHSSWYCETS